MRTIRRLTALGLLGALTAVPLRCADLGEPAAPLKIAAWVKGKPVDLAAGKGKTIHVVEFWATWCGPCRTSIPHLTELQKKFKDKGVVFVGVSDEELATVKPFVEKMGEAMEYLVAVDDAQQTTQAYMKAFGVNSIPHAFVIDKEGKIAWHGHPMGGLEGVIEQMLAGKFDLEKARKTIRASTLMRQFFTLVMSGRDAAKADELGAQIVADAAGDAILLNEFAWALLTDQRVKHRNLELAVSAAQAAYEACSGKEFAVVDTYARALFDTGKVAEAIKYQKKALELCKEPTQKEELARTLSEYKQKAEKR
jgi:thiol-disulfide isomerase/thioredoxin